MNSKNKIALSTVFGGTLLFLGGLGWLRVMPPKIPNYSVVSVLEETFMRSVRLGLLFLLGSYLGAAILRFFSKKEKEILPFVAALGAGFGLLLGFIISGIFTGLLYPFMERMRSIGILRTVTMGIPFIFSFLGARFACRFERKLPPTLFRRSIPAMIGMVIFATPLCFTFPPRSDFPSKAPIEVRHAWALKKFKDHYPHAVQFIQNSSVIRQDVGDRIVIAPAVNSPNYFIASPADPGSATFTLEVEGEKGKGICSMNVVIPDYSKKEEANLFNMTWAFGGKKVPLVVSRKR
ncbi:MAG: hypothetical protein HY590_00465 [Candidatus Omnitrophica bacterium]|nr:hypothetical protein [Candidatus Omnitrophota bacterium]